eukprot:TRINITY_DN120980_c0_g1_i1.p1 TRINITY_DN120980_c0_g1~~TRINITY_DN120980_c0_g1_i1.p1  ORF type:complete len:518 (-),score=71.57 TRINITY_DN120980_c0_g1_i1:181-1734(-)
MERRREADAELDAATAAEVLTRGVLRDELNIFSEHLMQRVLRRSDADLQAHVSKAVSTALADRSVKDERLDNLPEMHPWMMHRPLRHDDVREGHVADRRDPQHAMKRALHRRCSERPPRVSPDSYRGLLSTQARRDQTCDWQSRLDKLRDMVRSDYFEQAALLLLILSASLVGIETYVNPDMSGDLQILDYMDITLCFLFCSELPLKIWAEGHAFFDGEGWKFNVFDACVVILVTCCQIVRIVDTGTSSRSILDMLRLLRLLRIARLVRVVHVAEDFSRLVTSLTSSLFSLVWVFELFVGLIYFFSVYFTHMVLAFASADHPNYPALMHRFGSLHRSGLSLFEAIFGGISWDEDVQLLIDCVSPIAGLVLCAYIGFCYTALLNLITGTFIDKALRAATQAEEVQLCSKVANLFFEADGDDDISWEQFNSKLSDPGMQDYLKAIDICPSEAESLFHLLDSDHSGSIDIAELVNGLLRLKGAAGALELALLMRETAYLCDRLESRLCSHHGSATSKLAI